MTRDLVVEHGLPCNIDAERVILAAVLMDDRRAADLITVLSPAEFMLEKHRRIYTNIKTLHDSGVAIDHVTLAESLRRNGQLESCDGITYLAYLSKHMPEIVHLEAYVAIVKDKALLRRTIVECGKFIDKCLLGQEEPGEILQEAGAVLSQLTEERTPHRQWFSPGEVIEGYEGGLNQFLCPTRGATGLSTPWPSLTEILCGFQPQDLVIVAGRPGMGKTVLALQQAYWSAKYQGVGAAYFSLEMSKESLVRRILASVARVDLKKARGGFLTEEERHRQLSAAEEIWQLPLFIDDSHANTPAAIGAALRRLTIAHPIGLVIVDHIQLTNTLGRSMNRHQELFEVSHAMKHLACKAHCTVMLLSQLNRDCERERRAPHLSDLKETGSLEEDADVVVFVHRPERYNRDDPNLHGMAQFVVAKQRNGPTGQLDMIFRHAFQRFEQESGEKDCCP